jgi:2-oxoglutarate dehydrogenase E1 component
MTTQQDEQSSFLSGTNGAFLEQLYQRYLSSPNSVDASWQQFFATLDDQADDVIAEARGASWAPRTGLNVPPDPYGVLDGDGAILSMASQSSHMAQQTGAGSEDIRRATLDSLQALMMIRAHRVRGHLHAKLDPLGLTKFPSHAELDPRSYGFNDADMDRPIFLNYVLGLESATIREIMDILNRTYCSSIGVEFMHIHVPEEKSWIQQRIEGRRKEVSFTDQEKRRILRNLVESEGFERFLQLRYTGTKRFGLEGAESTMAAMAAIANRAGQLGVKEISLGMPHRGRLNVLSNFMDKPFTAIFSEFEGNTSHPDDVQGSGDVKYHLGTSADRDFNGNTIHLSLAANPSHLELVNPVALGKSRAKQTQRGDEDRSEVMTLLLHGDAAFAGQGIIGECFMLSDLEGYSTGGTVHLVVNNQISFTTNPNASRSSPYTSDVAKSIAAPIFHVNGDDPEAVCHTAKLAMEYRQQFKKDVVVDVVCYRRHGHNEGDEPAFTQPRMYRKIAKHPTTRQIYADKLVGEGVVSQEEADGMVADFQARLEQDFEAAKSFKANQADWLDGAWKGMERAKGEARRGDTDVKDDILKHIGDKLTEVPADFNLHRTVKRLLDNKKNILAAGEGIDWATAEALALGSLLLEGYAVRLSGQDSARGTFSQRHAQFIDQEDEHLFTPLNNLDKNQAEFEVINSPLSELAVMGFEYGYTMAEPNCLVLWEAQFGDFANGAQMIMDQFVSSAESKWLRMSGLVLLLPHGFEGQGPEHSSARLERYLQLCAEDNMQVANCTTPSNYFHILRRQMHRRFRKPLILMTPKSLLRHKLATSKLSDMAQGSTFHRVLWDDLEWEENNWLREDKKIKRVVLCTGKVYYDLYEARNAAKRDDVYVMRLEQLYPFPTRPLMKELRRFPGADIVWCQEEPENMGAWNYLSPRIEAVLTRMKHKVTRAEYAGRPESAATAAGSMARHQLEQAKLVDDALN